MKGLLGDRRMVIFEADNPLAQVSPFPTELPDRLTQAGLSAIAGMP